MALSINEKCVSCRACLPLCPQQAIHEAAPHFIIHPGLCSECNGDYDDPQCATICPVEEAILDGGGLPLNPLGSLTGVPAEVRLAQGRSL